MNWRVNRHQRRSGWRGYLQGIQVGTFLMLLCYLPDVLILDLITSAGAGARPLIWGLRLILGVLPVCWLFLALQIGAGSREDTPQANGLATMLLLWIAEQSVFLLLATQQG